MASSSTNSISGGCDIVAGPHVLWTWISPIETLTCGALSPIAASCSADQVGVGEMVLPDSAGLFKHVCKAARRRQPRLVQVHQVENEQL